MAKFIILITLHTHLTNIMHAFSPPLNDPDFRKQYLNPIYEDLKNNARTQLINQGEDRSFTCKVDVGPPSKPSCPKPYSKDPDYADYCLPGIIHVVSGTDQVVLLALLLNKGRPDTAVLVKADEVKSRTDSDVTLDWPSGSTTIKMTYSTKFMCQDSGKYICNDGDKGDNSTGQYVKDVMTNADMKLVVDEEVYINQKPQSASEGEPVIASLRQGFSQMITCSVVTAPHAFTWEWGITCSCTDCSSDADFNEFSENNVEYQNSKVYLKDNCWVARSNATNVFFMTPELDGCTLRCSLKDKRDNYVMKYYDINLSMSSQKSPTFQPNCDPIIHVVIFAMGVITAGFGSFMAHKRYKEKNAFYKHNWSLFKEARNK